MNAAHARTAAERRRVIKIQIVRVAFMLQGVVTASGSASGAHEEHRPRRASFHDMLVEVMGPLIDKRGTKSTLKPIRKDG